MLLNPAAALMKEPHAHSKINVSALALTKLEKTKMTESNEPTGLISLTERVTSEVLDNNGLQPILDEIAVKARGYKFDVATKKGREDIASLGYKISRSKTFIEKRAKDHVAELKAQIKPVDDMRISSGKFFDVLRDEIKAPLVEWENAETLRVGTIQKSLDAVKNIHAVPFGTSSEKIQSRIDRLKAPTSIDWMEFEAHYTKAKALSLQLLEQLLVTQIKTEADQAELEELRKQKAAAVVAVDPASADGDHQVEVTREGDKITGIEVKTKEETLTPSTKEASMSTETSTKRGYWRLQLNGFTNHPTKEILEEIAEAIKAGKDSGEIIE